VHQGRGTTDAHKPAAQQHSAASGSIQAVDATEQANVGAGTDTTQETNGNTTSEGALAGSGGYKCTLDGMHITFTTTEAGITVQSVSFASA
jgi:hypothetical protein